MGVDGIDMQLPSPQIGIDWYLRSSLKQCKHAEDEGWYGEADSHKGWSDPYHNI